MDLFPLLNNIISKKGIKFLSNKIEVNTGAIKRWISENHIPNYYKLDLYKLNNINIDYDTLTDREKDKFYTDTKTAEYCYNTFKSKLQEYGEDLSNFTFVEPSVGNGSFFNLIEYEKIGIDIQPEINDAIKIDYLEWSPDDNKKK